MLFKRLPKIHPRHNDQSLNMLLNDLDYFKADAGAFYAKELVLDLVRPNKAINSPRRPF
jgi:hypothetical protein